MKKMIDTENLSRQEAAAIFGVSLITINNWIRSGCPVNPNNKLHSADVHKWKVKYTEDMAVTQLARNRREVDEDGDEWDSKWKEMRAKMKELEYAEALKTFARIDDVAKHFTRGLTAISQALQELPVSMALKLQGKDKAEIQSILRKALEDAVRRGKEIFRENLKDSDDD